MRRGDRSSRDGKFSVARMESRARMREKGRRSGRLFLPPLLTTEFPSRERERGEERKTFPPPSPYIGEEEGRWGKRGERRRRGREKKKRGKREEKERVRERREERKIVREEEAISPSRDEERRRKRERGEEEREKRGERETETERNRGEREASFLFLFENKYS